MRCWLEFRAAPGYQGGVKLAALDSLDPAARVVIDVNPGDVVYIGRNPFHGGEPPEPEAKILCIPWSDRVVNRHHSMAKIGEGFAELEVCAPPQGEGPRSPFSVGDREGAPTVDRASVSVGQRIGVGKRPRTFLCLLEHDSGALAGHETERCHSGGAADRVPHFARVQLRLFQDELPQRLAQWKSADELFDRAGGFLEMAARNLGAGRSVWAFCSPGEGEDWRVGSLIPLTSDHTAIADFRVCQSIVDAVRRWGASGPRVWGGAELPRPPDLAAEADAVICGLMSAPLHGGSGQPQGEATFRYHGRSVLLYGELRAADGGCVEAVARIAAVVSRLVAALLGAHEHMRREEALKAHFSPRVRSFVVDHPDKLKPAMHRCTVLFCDRRSSSKVAESAVTDADVIALLRRNQEILGRVTDVVFRWDGAVADFAGDCVLGYWGWPPGQGEPDHACQAVRAAEEIVRNLADLIAPGDERLPVCRIGISTGAMAVGNVGPPQQMKISLFGNPINFASRLEGLGKKFRVPALLAEETAKAIRDSGEFRVRRLCRLRPAGFQRAYNIYELVLPKEVLGSGATDEQIAIYESALAEFERRDWAGALHKLRQLPGDDEPAFWLAREVDRCRETPPPPEWQGEVEVREK